MEKYTQDTSHPLGCIGSSRSASLTPVVLSSTAASVAMEYGSIALSTDLPFSKG